ncbi:hypothetical protein EOA30_05000 [Mesorhizobium sp. M8A.F.Ca.ET.059.01.1.1]|nr:hypothetical protein EOA30_05000 [Mesorhizobium sp. M8A.F.Ca.ET.059.01.1.1]
MAYHVREKAVGSCYYGFYVYNHDQYIAGPWVEGWKARNYIEALTDGRYMAKADRTTVLRGRRRNVELVLRDERDHQLRLLAPRPLG